MKNKFVIFMIPLFLMGCLFSNEFNIKLWEKGDASSDPRVSKIERHHACSGNVLFLKTSRMPQPGEGPFEAEKVIELSKDNKILRMWFVPVDEVVLGVQGDFIITGYCNNNTGLQIGIDGSLKKVKAPTCDKEIMINCPLEAENEFPNSDYLRCFKYRDLNSTEERILAYEGPCT